jgi:UDP-N-acetylmuramyl tripeptide synthase
MKSKIYKQIYGTTVAKLTGPEINDPANAGTYTITGALHLIKETAKNGGFECYIKHLSHYGVGQYLTGLGFKVNYNNNMVSWEDAPE